MANHLGLDLNLVELLAGVNTNDTANHFGYDDHVTKVRLHEIRFLVGFSLLLGFSQLLNQTHGLSLKTAVKPAASASMDDIPELFGREVEEPVGRESLEPSTIYGVPSIRALCISRNNQVEQGALTYWSSSIPR